MRKDRIALLRDRFLKAKEEFRDPYFDADEIDDLLSSFDQSGELDIVEELIELGLRLHPGNTSLKIRRCRLHLVDNEVNEALELVRQIGEQGNQELDIVELECYIALEKYDKVVKLTNKLIEQKVDYLLFVFEYIVPLLNDEELHKEAVDFAERGLKLFPGNFVIREELCYALENINSFDRAITLCNELIDIKPYSFDLWFALGRLYAFSENYPKAIEAFDFALTCNESAVELKLLLVFCLLKNDNFERASLLCKEILPEAEDKDAIVVLLAECLMNMNRSEEAYLYLKEYMGNSDVLFSSAIYILYARSCVETDRDDEAFETIRKVFVLYPDEPGLRFFSHFLPSLMNETGTVDSFFAELGSLLGDGDIEEMVKFLEAEESKFFDSGKDGFKEITRSLADNYITNKGNRN